jgi:hypothetical protein
MWVITQNVRRDSVDPSPTEKHLDRVKRPKLNIDSYREEKNVPRTIVGFKIAEESKPQHWTVALWKKIVRSIKFN